MSKIAGQWNIFYIFGQKNAKCENFLNGKIYGEKRKKSISKKNEARFLEECSV